MAQGYTNDFNSTLSSGYTAGGTSLSIASSTGLPASGTSFYLKVDSEYFLCTSYTGGTLTVTGAQAGSTAANHANGAGITGCWVLPAVLDGIRSDMHQEGPIASLPAASKLGNLYLPTDSVYEYLFDTGTAWDYHYRGLKVTPPVSGNFAWNNQGSSTATVQTNGAIILSSPSNGAANNIRIYEMAAPATPWTKTFRFTAAFTSQNFSTAGVSLRESATGKVIEFAFEMDGSLNFVKILNFTNVTTFSASATQAAFGSPANACFKVGDDGTNLTYSFSHDNGVSFVQLAQTARGAFFTTAPDHVGVCLNPFCNSYSASVGLTLVSVD